MSHSSATVSGRLNARREAGVRALVEVLTPHNPDAVTLALKRAAAAVAVPGLPEAEGDRAVRDAARAAAAEHLEFQLARSGARSGGRLRRGTPCAEVPRVLAADVAGSLGEAGGERLRRHLARCPSCTALRNRFMRADAAFDTAFPDAASAGVAGDAKLDWLAEPAAASAEEPAPSAAPSAVAPEAADTSAWLPEGEPITAARVATTADTPSRAAGHELSFVPPDLAPSAVDRDAASTPAEPTDDLSAWLLPGAPSAPAAGAAAEPDAGAAAPAVPSDPDAWLVEGLASSPAAADAEEQGSDAWVVGEDLPITPILPSAAAAPSAAARPSLRVLRTRGAAVLPVVVVLAGAGTMVAIAANVTGDDEGGGSPPATLVPATGAGAAASTPKKTPAHRAKPAKKHRKRATAKRKATTAPAQAVAAPAVAVSRPVSQPVQQAPVQTPVQRPTSTPVQKPATSTPKPAAQTSTPAPTATPGPTGAAPSDDPGRTATP